MPELPDIVVYAESLQSRLAGATVERIRIMSPFVVRSVEPEISTLEGRSISRIGRLGKQFVFDFGDQVFAAIHLMIAGRFRWLEAGKKPPAKITLAAFHFDRGTLALTEASKEKRAAINAVSGIEHLSAFDARGLEILSPKDTHVFPLGGEPAAAGATQEEFTLRISAENHTLKRALTDPRNFSGIGNAYADEILHAARLSPVQWTSRLSTDAIKQLFYACRETLGSAVSRLREKFKNKFPGAGEITAFRPEFAVHGKFGKPCPLCGTAVQRIRYAEHETDYCPRCQTGGKVLADRSLSRLLRDDWPRTVEELESLKTQDLPSSR